MMPNNKKIVWAKLSVFSNLILFIFKFIVFIFTGAVSILSEAIHSVIDLIAALMAYTSVTKSSIPPDKDHPFGHGKYENLSGFVESILIILAAIYIIYEAISKFRSGHNIENIDIAILVMGISALVNFFVSNKLHNIAKETDSIAIETDAAHLSIDVYTCLGVFLGMIIIRITGLSVLDPIVSIFIAIYIFYLGFSLTKRSTVDLLDTSLSKADIDRIENIISDHLGSIVSFHKLATRRAGSDKIIEVHMQFSPTISLKDAHNIAHHIKDDICALVSSSRVIVHIEPCKEICKECNSSDCKIRKE